MNMQHDPRYEWQLLRAGTIWLDGGAMFGIIPRTLWTRIVQPDPHNRIELAHNCLLLTRDRTRIVIETGSGNWHDDKWRKIYSLGDYTIGEALRDAGCSTDDVRHVIVSHLHFDHAGGLVRRDADGKVRPNFPNADVAVQFREWEDALANHSHMTRTYFREQLDPIREHVRVIDSPAPFERGHVFDRDETPPLPLEKRMTDVLPGVRVFRIPGHTWGQQAITFTDTRGRTIVFSADLMPTAAHIGSAYNMAYDVEPFTSTNTRTWFLAEAAKNDWLLVLDHEPGHPLVRVRADGKGWYQFVKEED